MVRMAQSCVGRKISDFCRVYWTIDLSIRTSTNFDGCALSADRRQAVSVSSIVISDLDYAPPGSDSLFFDISFNVSPGDHAAIIGANGAGKSTILRILSGKIDADGGELAIGGTFLTMSQDVGMGNPDATLREMLIDVAVPELRSAGRALIAAEAALADGTDDGTGHAEAITDWGDLGGYELEAEWAAAAERSVKTPITDFSTRLVGELSGGERKRLVLDLLLNSGVDVLLLDEPDNYLDPDPSMARRPDFGLSEHDSHGEPRPFPTRTSGDQSRRARGRWLLGSRWFVCDIPRSPSKATGTTR